MSRDQELEELELENLAETASKAGVFETFLSAVRAAEMIHLLQAKAPFTLFAPTDKAFAKFSPSMMAKLLNPENRELLVSVVGYHLAPGAVRTQTFAGKRFRAKTHAGTDLRIEGRGDVVTVNGAPLVKPDLIASNGVLHGIDQVLWPKSPQATVAVPATTSA